MLAVTRRDSMLSWTKRRRGRSARWRPGAVEGELVQPAAAVPPIAVLAPGGAARRVRAALGALVVAAAAVCACSSGPGGPRGAGTDAPTDRDTDAGPPRTRCARPADAVRRGHPHPALDRPRRPAGRRGPRAAGARGDRELPEPARHGLGGAEPGAVPGPVRLELARPPPRPDQAERRHTRRHLVLRAGLDEGGRAGRTDWDRLEVHPDRAHVADFAALSAAVARRYR